jgi:hypothetical protein
MRIKINNTELPVDAAEELEPITIRAAISDGECKTGWAGEIILEVDSGADIVTIPLPILKKLLGNSLRFDDLASMETADGTQSQVGIAKISLRIKTENGEVVTLHDVDCAVTQDGSALLGRNVLQVFKVVLVQNKIQSMILSPKTASWFGLIE